MKRILIIITTAFELTGGLTTVMMNYYRLMDKSQLRIDFASTNEAEEKLREELHHNGSEYYNMGSRKKCPLRYMKRLKELLMAKQYDIIHINGNSSTMIMEARVARKCGVNEIICHTHTSQSEYPLLHKFLSRSFRKSYTKAIAVSKKSGRWLYGEEFTVLNNAIDVNKYIYNPKIRTKVRKKLGIDSKYVIGTVGKLTESKNQAFLLEIFADYVKNNSGAILVIAGGGDQETKLKQKAHDLGIENEVVFLGMKSNIEEILQAFDIFVFTSLYEGFGMVLVEAQAAGLYCISADTVPKETQVTSNIEYLSLSLPVKSWADAVKRIQEQKSDREILSRNAQQSIAEYGYDIFIEAKKLERIYLG